MYKVLTHFHDLQDVEKKTKDGPIYHEYTEGDTYPRDGYKPSQERIEELSGIDNAFGTPIIEAADKVVDDNDNPPASEPPADPPADPPAEAEEATDKPGGKKASK